MRSSVSQNGPGPKPMAPRPIRLLRGFFTVGVWTMGSRVLGLARDLLMAALLGAGPVADAFLVAFSLPNMFRRFFGEAALNAAFVPIFSKKLEAEEDAKGFAQDAFSGLAGILVILTLVALLAMPWLALAMAGGFAQDGRMALAVDYGRLTFVYILFISLAALLSGVLNATGRFGAAAAAPILLNVVLLSALFAASFLVTPGDPQSAETYGRALAIAVPIAGLAQVALVWFAAARAGFRLGFRWPRMTPDLKRLALVALPAILAGGVMQINLLVGRHVASYFDGAISWLSYSDRIYQLPLGVVGIAIGVVLLPALARRLEAGDTAGGRAAFSRAGEVAMALTIPAAIALVVIPAPLISIIFERGEFTADDTQATALALAVYGLGLPAFVLQKVYQPLYFAREDTKSPFRFALVAMVVNAVVAVGLGITIGFIGAAIATTAAAWVMVLLLARGRGDMGDVARFDDRFQARIWRIVAASLAMGAFLWSLAWVLEPWLNARGWRIPTLGLLVVAGIAAYAVFGRFMGAFKVQDFRDALRRSSQTPQ